MRFLTGTMIAEACQKKNVEAAIHNFQVKDDTIDLLAISHFDKDHVSGVVKLLEENKVDTIILPYLALPIRILQAVQSDGEISLEYTEFILNPVAFFNRIARDRIKQIVFVLPTDPDELLDDEHPGKDPEGKADSKKAKLNFNPVKKTRRIFRRSET
jgi:metal-dependent hydrolase (beta-lactamase superfamily II)